MSWRNNKKEPPKANSSGSWTDNNTKKSKFSVSGLLKSKPSRKNYLIIVGIVFVLALLLGIVTIILISTQSQATTQSQGTTQSQETTQAPYNPRTDPNCSNCTCYAYIDLALDSTTDLTPDEFKLQNEFINYYISKLYDPEFLANHSQVDINYGVDGGNFGIKWPNTFETKDTRTLHEYFKDGDILKQQQEPGKFNDLYNILFSIFLNNVYFCLGSEYLDFYDDSRPQNNIVFMGSPSITAPPNNTLDLTFFQGTTYNGTNEINLTEHYLRGPTGRNKLIVILMKEDTAEEWKKTNLQQWLDAGLRVLQYTNDSQQLFYDVRKLLSCNFPEDQTYMNLSDIKETSFSNTKFTTNAISKDITISETFTTRPKSIHQNSTKKQN